MNQDCTTTEVIVVGGGPVGLMLACELRLGGAKVVVLEQLAAPTTESRASTLHARTMEILDSRGLLDGLGEIPDEPRGHFGGLPLELTLPSPYPGQWKVPQTRLEELLGARAAQLGADVRRSHEVTALRVTDSGAEAEVRGPGGRTLRFRAPYLVGCDGEDSAVRRLGGFRFPGTDAARELLRADVAGVDIPNRRFERLPAGLAIAARRPDGVTRVMVHRFGARPQPGQPEFADVVDAWKGVTGEDLSGGTPLWVNSFGDAARQVTAYRRGPLLLAGDAAHRQMPIGGQALNLGLQDAVNLGWKLAAQVTGRAPQGLLETYHTERHPVGARVLGNIAAQARLLLGGPEVDALRGVLAELIPMENVRTRLAGMVSGLDITYAMGDDAGRPPIGQRLTPRDTVVDGTPVGTAELLRTGQGLLVVPPGATDLCAAAAPWAESVRAVDGGPGDTDALLVRPDGYVAWAGTSAAEATAALRRWFGEPSAAGPSTAGTSAAEPSTVVRPAAAARASATATPKNWRTDMAKLTGRIALVTGASRGMGRATALRLAAEGALVAVHYTSSEDAAADVVATIEKDGGRAFTVRAELGVPGDVHELFLGLEEGLRERTGSTDLDILVNNAGVMGGVKPEDTTPEAFDRIFAVNAKAPFFLIQRALKNLRDGGRIINISSGLTRVANPDEIAYAMTKGAVEQLALHFAKHLGPRGITVNSVAPGITRNGNPVFDIPEAVEQMARLSAFGRVGEPEDVADVVAFLATDEARWITGAFIDATGGTLLG
ncbi:SDR family oxidoreductase [Streptomyces sp. Ru72]|uniref:SDR family oxidoreductase n=1 Tax=Streptomyces sp. Ru72 TaxID=2080747 RepID=UPI000CDDAF7A|nr:SDR family oxidoreductase [Streptomyces sp. Ru72]POX46517.1 monooxygenase [Streptomyces sp. Ru72]